MKFSNIFVAAVLVASLAACGDNKVSFATTEAARAQALDNVEYNATKFRAKTPQYVGYSIQMQGDSTQKESCPQGDGWASGKLVSPDATQVVRIKCSTVSATKGCMLDAEFKTKEYTEDARSFHENMKEEGFNINTVESEGYLRGRITAFNLVEEEDKDV